MKIPKQLIDQIVAQAREELPNECCGLIGGREGTADAAESITPP